MKSFLLPASLPPLFSILDYTSCLLVFKWQNTVLFVFHYIISTFFAIISGHFFPNLGKLSSLPHLLRATHLRAGDGFCPLSLSQFSVSFLRWRRVVKISVESGRDCLEPISSCELCPFSVGIPAVLRSFICSALPSFSSGCLLQLFPATPQWLSAPTQPHDLPVALRLWLISDTVKAQTQGRLPQDSHLSNTFLLSLLTLSAVSCQWGASWKGS